jgi:phospholipase/lecithinase/hemolysin
MDDLAQFGALNLLILNLPDLGAIPDTLGSPEAPEATAFSNDFNAGLANMLAGFKTDYPEIQVLEFDVFSYGCKIQLAPRDIKYLGHLVCHTLS